MFLVDICLLVFIHWDAGSGALLTTKYKLIAVIKKTMLNNQIQRYKIV